MQSSMRRKLNNRGFTLMELVVVLVIMGILLSLTALGIMSWQDWSKMKQLNANAETIFMAVQNQLSAYSASGSLEREVEEALKGDDGVSFTVPELTRNGADGSIAVGSILDSEGKALEWDKLWSTGEGKLMPEKYQGRIVSISCSPGEYEKYLKGEEGLNSGTQLLFKLVTSYIYDKALLNDASILVEFSPDAAQVFAVCYSTDADHLVYTGGDGSIVNDRTESVRNEMALGYYGVDTLSKSIKGRTDNTLDIAVGAFELRNGEILEALYSPEVYEDVFGAGKKLHFTLNLYNPDISDNKEVSRIMSLEFDLDSSKPLPADMRGAQGSGATVMKAVYYKDGSVVDMGGGNIVFRVPVWQDLTAGGSRAIRIALDAADVQAQSVTAASAMGMEDDKSESFVNRAAEAFSKTYSFYRFGLDADRIYLGLVIRDDSAAEEGSEPPMTEEVYSAASGGTVPNLNGEYTAFAKVERSGDKADYEITNGRHFYNIRFAADYADMVDPLAAYSVGSLANNKDWHTSYSRSFVIKKNINWHGFTAYKYKGSNAGNDYYFNSYDSKTEVSDGGSIVYSGIGLAGIETETVEFPSFRKLAYGDSLSAAAGVTVSDLTITTDANERFGIYGNDAMETNINYMKSGVGTVFDELELERAKGMHPTGLFAYNFGTIKDLTLSRHKVFGGYKTGGFVGENLGKLSGLVLKNEKNTSAVDKSEEALVKQIEKIKLVVPYFNGGNKVDGVYYYTVNYNYANDDSAALKSFMTDELYGKNTSFVVGIHDVGGICGYQKYVAGSGDDSGTAVYTGLKNEAYVCGQDYIGGIIGRSIVNYSENAMTDRYLPAFDNSEGSVIRRISLKKAEYRECANSGRTEPLPIYDIPGYTNDPGIVATPPNARSSHYIGGICGMACDNSTSFEFTPEAAAIIFTSCSNSQTYSEEEIAALINGEAGNTDAVKAMLRGSYKGGLAGFARRVFFDRCTTGAAGEGGQSWIFGRYYAGGMAGVAQLCCFGAAEGEKSVNSTHVVARCYTGGIAGVIGTPKYFTLGDDAVGHFRKYQYEPYGLTLEVPAEGTSARQNVVENLKNTGLFYSFGSDAANGRKGCSGGICGYNGEELDNCDCLQSAYAKEMMLKLIAQASGSEENCADYSGGIAGDNSWRINFKAESSSNINAVVFAASGAGGAAGHSDVSANDNNSRKKSVLNCVLTDGEEIDLDTEGLGSFAGSYIRAAGDYAGGICGFLERSSAINGNTYPVEGSFCVHAKNYAGGFIGFAKGRTYSVQCQYAGTVKAKTGAVQKVTADGFFAGGFTGAAARHSIYKDTNTADSIDAVSGVSEVRAKYFAGGFSGASIVPANSKMGQDTRINERHSRVENNKMIVAADVCAGGYYGYYEVCDGEWDEGVPTLMSLLKGSEGDSAKFAQALGGLNQSTMKVSSINYNSNTGATNWGDTANNLRFETDGPAVSTGSVTAQYYAGGLFGYVPDSQSIYISYTGSCNVSATGTPIGGFSYAGGITGRVGTGMVLHSCLNTGVLYSKADYYGNLCELNRGTIEDCTVGYAFVAADGTGGYTGSHRYVGGLCGRNEGMLRGTFGSCRALGNYSRGDVAGLEYTGGLCGENVATIYISGGDFHYVISVDGENFAGGVCGVNRGEIRNDVNGARTGYGSDGAWVSGKYPALLTGRNEGTIDGLTIDSKASLKASNSFGETGSAAVFAGVNAGVIKNCVNKTNVRTDNGNGAAFAGEAKDNASFENLVNRARISAAGTAAGIVALTGGEGTAVINNCRNHGAVSADSGNAYGITAGSAEISHCLEAGGIRSVTRIYGGLADGGNNYYLAGTLDTANASANGTGLAALFAEKNGTVWDLYRISGDTPKKTDVSGLVYDPLGEYSEGRADELDNAFESKL